MKEEEIFIMKASINHSERLNKSAFDALNQEDQSILAFAYQEVAPELIPADRKKDILMASFGYRSSEDPNNPYDLARDKISLLAKSIEDYFNWQHKLRSSAFFRTPILEGDPQFIRDTINLAYDLAEEKWAKINPGTQKFTCDDGSPGIWMTTENVPFDKEEVRNSEREKQRSVGQI